MATIRQVAQACGVSPMTVSFVLNDIKGQVSEDTRQRVLRTVRELGYRPRATDTGRSGRQMSTLGVVAGVEGHFLMTGGYFRTTVEGILAAAHALRQNVTLFTSALFHTDSLLSIRTYCDGRCDGLMVIAPDADSDLVTTLYDRGTPAVVLGDSAADERVAFVDVDNDEAAFRAVGHLLDLGHRRIAYLDGPAFTRSASQRRSGYERAHRERGAPLDRSLMTGPLRYDQQGAAAALSLLQRPPGDRPTALFCWHDDSAFAVLRALEAAGISVPGQVSVLGFNDDERAAASNPPLTTVRQPLAEIAARAVEILLAQIRGEETAGRVFLDTQLVTRASVGPPPRQG